MNQIDSSASDKFGSLEFGIWILFDICYLMLGIFYIQRLNIYLAILFDFLNVFLGHNTIQ